MTKIRFKVSSYALFEALRGLELSGDKYMRVEYQVTREDGDLVVCAEERYLPYTEETPMSDFCKPENREVQND